MVACVECDAAGISEANVDVFQAVDYYRTLRRQNACAPNRLRLISLAGVIAFHL